MKNKIFIVVIATILLLTGGFILGRETAPVEKEIEFVDVIKTEKVVDVQTKYIAYNEAMEEVNLLPLGNFNLTAYCACMKCCGKTDGITATGTHATANRTIAVDPSVIAYGSHVIITGQEYIAEDCGGAIDGNRIDIYFDTHQEALNFGRQTAEVYIVNN